MEYTSIPGYARAVVGYSNRRLSKGVPDLFLVRTTAPKQPPVPYILSLSAWGGKRFVRLAVNVRSLSAA